MIVTARWPRIQTPALVGGGALLFVAAVAHLTIVAMVMLAALAVYMVAGVKVQFVGGGFRPLRMVDMIHFNAADHLDAYDREQAAAMRR